MTTRSLVNPLIYDKILSNFPQNIAFCFAYGSAVMKQLSKPNPTSKPNMIDLIFCVNDSQSWHKNNLRMNPSHYSSLRYLGPNFIAKLQENAGAKLYFNTLVTIEGTLIKYGVISCHDLVTDLYDWSHLYASGRLHKPVDIIKHLDGDEMLSAVEINLKSAVHASLLMLPEKFSEYELFYTISNLSYAGDFRMTFGENKNKVENIVKPQVENFRALYRPALQSLREYVEIPAVGVNCTQDTSPLSKLHHLNQLPRWPQKALSRSWNKGSLRQDTEDVLRAIAHSPDCGLVVHECLKDIVWKSSVKQSLKGILTAGFLKSIKYSWKKITKMLAS